MADSINKRYEARHQANIQRLQKKVKAQYEIAVGKIYKAAAQAKLKRETFRLSDYPELSKEIDKVLVDFREQVNVTLINGVKGEWELSTEKNAEIINTSYAKKKISDAVNKMIYDPHEEALESFLNRSSGGMKLSDRVWRYTDQFRSEIEQNLFAGLSEGKSAAEMARDHMKYLQNPHKLFRRVKDAKGRLQLSKAAKAYKPGRGVYRSSYRNAMRLTRHTINDTYRQADMVRYQTLPFILGYNVNLSNNHPRFDICDSLTGTYPKTFVWRAWHVQCMCNCTPKLASPEDYDKYEEAILKGTAGKYSFQGEVKALPDQFEKYVEDKKGSMDNWKRKPDWVTDNKVSI
jgi:hypothetical protein